MVMSAIDSSQRMIGGSKMFVQVELHNTDKETGFFKDMGIENVGVGTAIAGSVDSLSLVVENYNILGYVGNNELLGFKKKIETEGLALRSLTAHSWDWVDRVAGIEIDEKEVENLCRTIDSMGKAKVETLIMPCSRKPLSSLSLTGKDDFRRRVVQIYREISKVAERSGVRICTHTSFMPDIMIHDYKTLDHFLEETGSKANGLLFCIGSISLAGYKIDDFIERYHDAIYAVHVKNVTGDWEENIIYSQKHNKHREVRFDAGQVDIPSAISLLASYGYEGGLTPEHFPPIDQDEELGLSWAVAYIKGICDSIQRKR